MTEQISKEEVSFQLISCISSGQEFSLNSPIIFEYLSQQSKPYVNAFLSCLKDIFVSDEYAPMLKFYSLFLLVKASEQNNPMLMTQIGRNKDLLNYIFKAVQYDHKKPVQERGHAFFSKNPSQENATIGHNFVVLLLEAFQYWAQAYQSTETENPLHIYMSMFKSLSSKIEFPAQARYVGQNHEMTEDFHLKPVETLSGQSGAKSINAQKSPTQQTASNSKKPKASNFSNKPKVNMQDLVVSHIEACCTTTGENYSKNIGTVLQHLQGSDSKEYIDELLVVVGSLLESPTTKPLVKLYTMWVLIKATETKNKVLVSELARSETVLNQVLQAAQFDYDKSFDEKGLGFFTESDIGNKYVNSSLEAVKYWATEFGSSDPTNPFYSFTFMYDSLKTSMIFPNRYTYIGTSPQTDIMTLGGIDLQKLAADFGQKDVFQPAVSSSSQDPLIANVEAGFQRLKEGKLMVREALENQPEEDPNMREFFDYLIEDLVRITDQELQPHIEPLIGYSNPAAEKYVTQGFAEVENVQKIKSEYTKYKNKKQGYSQFRQTSLLYLQESDVVGVQPSRPQNTGKSQFNESPARPLSRASAQEEIPQEDDFFGTGGAINVNKSKNVRGGFQTESPSKYSTQKPQQPAPTGSPSKFSAQKPSPFQPQPQEEEDDFFGTGGAVNVNKSKNVRGGFQTEQKPSAFQPQPQEEEDFFGSGGQAKAVTRSKNVKGGFSGGPSSSQKPMSESPSKMQVQQQIDPIPVRQEPVNQVKPAAYQEPIRQQPQKVKKPAIIGEDSKPLSNKDFYPQQQNEWEDDNYNRLSSSQFGKDRYAAYPSFPSDNQAGNRRFASSAQDDYSETQQNNRPYLEDTRYKWLSNYRFKAGILQDDKEDPEIEIYQLRTGELCDDVSEESLSPHKASHLKADQDQQQEIIGLPKEILPQEVEKKAVLPPSQDKSLTKGQGSFPAEESMKESMLTSLKSPSNRKDLSTDLGNIERGIKSSSKVKAAELAKIETSIRSSFKQSGKNVPNFQNLQDLETKEEIEKELTKLRTENSRLQRENKFLKEEADKNRTKLENSFDQVEVEKLIKNYDHQVTHLREELSVVKDENLRLNQDLSVLHEERKSQNPTANALYDENQNLKQQLEKLKKEMSVLKGYEPSPRSTTLEKSNILPMSKNASAKTFVSGQPDLVQSKQGSKRAIFEKVNYEKPQLLMTGEDVVLQSSFKNLQPTSTVNKESRYNHPDYEYTSPKGVKPSEEKPFRSPSPSHDSGLGVSLHQHESPVPRHRVEGSPQDAISKEEEFTRMLAQYHLLSSKEKVKAGEDSEFDIKGMISSRKDEGQKEIRGIQIKGDALVLSNMARNVQYLHSSQELLRFRLACLKNKATLYENDIIQVGVISNVIREKTDEVNLLKLGLYFGSKTNQHISNFRASVANTKSFSGYVKSNRLEGTLEQGKQLKQQLAISFKSTPFECLQLNISFELDHAPVQFDISLPSVITKFMEFKYVSTEEFRERWKLRNHMVLKSEEIEIDPYIIRSTYDFKKYFGYLVDLKPMDEYDFVQGKKGIKLGGLFELESAAVDYLLKINILPSHKVVFQVACNEDKWDVASFLIQTLTFLFQKRN